jgi:hypothetical protein
MFRVVVGFDGEGDQRVRALATRKGVASETAHPGRGSFAEPLPFSLHLAHLG